MRRTLVQCAQFVLLRGMCVPVAFECNGERNTPHVRRCICCCLPFVFDGGALVGCRRVASMITRQKIRAKATRSASGTSTTGTNQLQQKEELGKKTQMSLSVATTTSATRTRERELVERVTTPTATHAKSDMDATSFLIGKTEDGVVETTPAARSVAANYNWKEESVTSGRNSGERSLPGTEVGSLLDIENPLNLRLATLMRQSGKAFRSIAVTFSPKRDLNFLIFFEDIASGAKLQCRLNEVQSVYISWVRQFRSSCVVLFVPTLSSANAVLFENVVLYNCAGRPSASDIGKEKELEEPDHVIMSYSKLREIICKKKKDEQVNVELLSNAVLNAYADQWRNFIHSPASCSPMAIVTAAFNFCAKPGQSTLNKELLHAQISAAATAFQRFGKHGSSPSLRGDVGVARKKDLWSLVFVSAPLTSASAAGNVVPLMQDLLSGEFVEPMLLGERNIVYIVGSGTAAECFSQFPIKRKGKQKISILLQDIENQLGMCRSTRSTLTTTLTHALHLFSRYTWMGLMCEEDGSLRTPRAARNFTPLHRRSVTCEILPTFLESSFGHALSNKAEGNGVVAGGAIGRGTVGSAKMNPRLEEHIKAIFNNSERLVREKEWRRKLRACRCFFVEVKSANVTAARRADNPFSERNGIVEFSGQFWRSLENDDAAPPPVETLTAKLSANGDIKAFIEPERCIPESLFFCGAKGVEEQSMLQAEKRLASNAIIIAWDVKRALLFLRGSARLQNFLYNGGRIWCAQYAQYLLKGFNHDNLATMERTLLQYHVGKEKLHPLEKLRIIFEKQLDVAVNTRQLTSILHRMDGLLAATEMELRGLQLASQENVTKFYYHLKTTHEALEKLVNNKIMEFTTGMDDDVRKKINFRSPQDISTIIYGGALCRHLASRYVPVQSVKTPVTALFPHAVCRVTATPIPLAYTQAETLLVSKGANNSGGGGDDALREKTGLTARKVRVALEIIEKYTTRNTLENLLHCTAVVVVTCKVRPGNFLEVFSLHCPSTSPDDELKYNVAIDDVVPLTDKPELLTIMQLKEKIATYKPLRELQPLKKYGKKSYDLRNLLILTNCTSDKLGTLVETGIVQTLAETVLGASGGSEAPLERVCFCDIQRALPPPPQGADSFESDFLGLVDVAENAGMSARGNWEALARDFVAVGGFEGALKALVSHCASLVGTARDPFRNTHPLPLSLTTGLQSLHGQERASTRGLLWIITPEKLHPLLHRTLRGRNISSGADAIERITVLLACNKDIDLSFFRALQQLRFTEKKMQLFEDGALFRAVLPECKNRVHGELCHTVTATGRLSSQSPNLQNIPREEDLRRLIVSRFGRKDGRMIEADYSQLEVVVLAALSRDVRMLQELRDNVDFHSLRVSLMSKEPYADVVRKVKKEKDPHYIQLRQQAKIFSFQRQYGAGISTIATTTGLTEQEVERLISAEEQHYKELGRYYRLVMNCVEAGADRLLRLRTLDAATWPPEMRRMILLTEPMHYFVVPTGSKFDFTKDKKSIPRLKNYPVQGLAGEIVQIMCGKIIRRFYERCNYDGKAFLVNTVHDCVWIDAHVSVADEVMRDVSSIMTSTSHVISTLWPDMKFDVPFGADIHIGPSLGEFSK